MIFFEVLENKGNYKQVTDVAVTAGALSDGMQPLLHKQDCSPDYLLSNGKEVSVVLKSQRDKTDNAQPRLYIVAGTHPHQRPKITEQIPPNNIKPG